jgi:hypothetical protein
MRRPLSLSRRIELLEDRLTPVGEPLIIEVQFVTADKRIVGGFQVRVDPALGPAKSSRAGVRSYR